MVNLYEVPSFILNNYLKFRKDTTEFIIPSEKRSEFESYSVNLTKFNDKYTLMQGNDEEQGEAVKRDYVYKDNRDNNNSNINRGNKYNTKYSNVQHNRKRGDNISDNNYKISKNLRHNRIKKENNNDYINANENGDESKNTKYSGTKYYHHYY